MKAFLLAAGLGTRLKPLTNEIPKCLVPICGKPLLFIWLDLIENAGINEVLINTHYFADKVKKALNSRNNKVNINLFYEPTLLGSAGTIAKNFEFIKEEENFFILYADNLTNVNLNEIWNYHSSINSVFTTFVYETNIPTEKGIFVTDNSGKVIDFEEKPQNPKSNLANSGIGVLNKKIFDFFTDEEDLDFGKDVMPKLLNNMYVLKTDKYLKDIGNISDYNIAQEEWIKVNSS